MKNYTKRIIACAAACAISLTMVTSSKAVANYSEAAEAAAYLKEHQIMQGDQSGNMLLEQGLTRAQMAVMLARITVNPEHLESERVYYAKQCHFTDVPEWARPYVGFCVSNHIVSGYDTGLYGAGDPVTPAQACTVMLRCLEDVEREWNYQTACQTAIEEGIAPVEATEGKIISRGNMAILIYRTMLRMSGENLPFPEMQNPTASDVPHIPKVGDRITCTDGYVYEIKDVSKYNNSMFAVEETAELPTPTCDWSLLPQPELPAAEARHFTSNGKEYLYQRNLYETRRMQYTLNNAIGANPETWKNGKPATKQNGEPLVDIKLSIPDDKTANPFWPWRSEIVTEYFKSSPPGTYYLEVWDVYCNGVFQNTRYYLYDE